MEEMYVDLLKATGWHWHRQRPHGQQLADGYGCTWPPGLFTGPGGERINEYNKGQPGMAPHLRHQGA